MYEKKRKISKSKSRDLCLRLKMSDEPGKRRVKIKEKKTVRFHISLFSFGWVVLCKVLPSKRHANGVIIRF